MDTLMAYAYDCLPIVGVATTLGITMLFRVLHTRAALRSTRYAHSVGFLPFALGSPRLVRMPLVPSRLSPQKPI